MIYNWVCVYLYFETVNDGGQRLWIFYKQKILNINLIIMIFKANVKIILFTLSILFWKFDMDNPSRN